MTARDVDDGMGTGSDEGGGDVEAALRRALSRPATAEELAGWDRVATAYRSAMSTRRGRRLHLVAGLPLSAAAAAAVLLPAGAVAAAYTGRLPAHVQHWAHRALAPIGVPNHPRSAPDESHRHHAPSPSPYLAHKTGPSSLPPPQHARAVRLCVVLSHTPHAQQGHVLTALQRLLPEEQDLHQTCRTLVAPRARHHVPTSSARPSPSPSPRSSTAPTALPARTPTPSPTPSPRASSSG